MNDASHAVTSADGTRIGYLTTGDGPGVAIVGGALRSASDYLPLAAALAGSGFTAHVMDRRGRGASGPQGADYAIEREAEDVAAVLRETGATRVFGHSFGGLVAALAAAGGAPVTHLAMYEPALSVAGSIPTSWIEPSAERLEHGDRRGAFAVFVKGSGAAPAALTSMPDWYVKLVLGVVVRGERWRRMDALQETSHREHREVRRFDGDRSLLAGIDGHILILAGAKSPPSITSVYAAFGRPVELMPGLGHTAPDEGAPERVADRAAAFFSGDR